MSIKQIVVDSESVSNLSELTTEQAQQVSGAGKKTTAGEIKAAYLTKLVESETK